MENKSDVLYIFSIFRKQIKNLLNASIKILLTDGGTKYEPIHAQFPQIIH